MARVQLLVVALSASWVFASPASAQDSAPPADGQPRRGAAIEIGAVMGVIAQPYAMGAVLSGPWSVRVSGARWQADCYGLQINAGRIVRGDESATHTLGGMWGRFRTDCWQRYSTPPKGSGQYFGFVYDFQVRGFFLEVAPVVFGDDNPIFGSSAGSLGRVYGQVGYVYRFRAG